jgi:hypothetical protein
MKKTRKWYNELKCYNANDKGEVPKFGGRKNRRKEA